MLVLPLAGGCEVACDDERVTLTGRESGWIGNTAHAPSVAPAPEGRIKQNSSKPKSNQYGNCEIREQFRAVIQNVMAHLVCHRRTNFRHGALVEQIIV